jgi:hypothetical protein
LLPFGFCSLLCSDPFSRTIYSSSGRGSCCNVQQLNLENKKIDSNFDEYAVLMNFLVQNQPWRDYILPASSCPALAVRDRVALQAQPGREPQPIWQQSSQAQAVTVESPLVELSLAKPSNNAEVTFAPELEGHSRNGKNEKKAAVEITSNSKQQTIESQEAKVVPLSGSEKKPEVERKSRPKVAPAKVSLTAAEQFELELESMRGIRLLEARDPRGEYFMYTKLNNSQQYKTINSLYLSNIAALKFFYPGANLRPIKSLISCLGSAVP